MILLLALASALAAQPADTAADDPFPEDAPTVEAGTFPLAGRSLVVLRRAA